MTMAFAATSKSVEIERGNLVRAVFLCLPESLILDYKDYTRLQDKKKLWGDAKCLDLPQVLLIENRVPGWHTVYDARYWILKSRQRSWKAKPIVKLYSLRSHSVPLRTKFGFTFPVAIVMTAVWFKENIKEKRPRKPFSRNMVIRILKNNFVLSFPRAHLVITCYFFHIWLSSSSSQIQWKLTAATSLECTHLRAFIWPVKLSRCALSQFNLRECGTQLLRYFLLRAHDKLLCLHYAKFCASDKDFAKSYIEHFHLTKSFSKFICLLDFISHQEVTLGATLCELPGVNCFIVQWDVMLLNSCVGSFLSSYFIFLQLHLIPYCWGLM